MDDKMKKEIILSSIIGGIIGTIITGSIGVVFAVTYNASNITYTPSDNTWNVTTVGQAINDLALSKTSDNYSTNETVVGTWTDGKPIYQKTISITTPTSNSYINNTGISNLDTLIDIHGALINSDNNVVILNSSYVYCTMYYNRDKNLLYMEVSNASWARGRQAWVTYKYTKTTDTAPGQSN